MSEASEVLVSRDGAIATLTINRPRAKNSLNRAVFDGLRAQLVQLRDDDAVRAVIITGAEGVFCAILPEQGLSFAVKCEDGTSRAAESMIAALLARHFDKDTAEHAALMAMANHSMHNWNGLHVGDVRVTDVLFG